MTRVYDSFDITEREDYSLCIRKASTKEEFHIWRVTFTMVFGEAKTVFILACDVEGATSQAECHINCGAFRGDVKRWIHSTTVEQILFGIRGWGRQQF